MTHFTPQYPTKYNINIKMSDQHRNPSQVIPGTLIQMIGTVQRRNI